LNKNNSNGRNYTLYGKTRVNSLPKALVEIVAANGHTRRAIVLLGAKNAESVAS
jgi:hypothetical protein